MVNSFSLGGRVVSLNVNQAGFGELAIEVQPPKSDAYTVSRIKLFKEQVAAHEADLTPGTPVLVFGSFKGRLWEGKWFTDLNCNEIFLPARRTQNKPPEPKRPVSTENDSCPFDLRPLG